MALARRHVLAYASGHVLNDLCSAAWFGYLLLLWNQVTMVSKREAGVLILVGQVADALATPVVGWASDRTQSRFGPRRPWHLAGTAAVVVSFPALLCAPPPWLVRAYQAGRHAPLFAYLAVFVVLFQLGWAATQVAHMAICPELSACAGVRTSLNSARYAATVLSNLAVYGIVLLLLGTDSGSSTALQPSDQPVFRDLALIVLALGVAASAFFHYGMWDLARIRPESPAAPSSPVRSVRHSIASPDMDTPGFSPNLLGQRLRLLPGYEPPGSPELPPVVPAGDAEAEPKPAPFSLLAAHDIQPPSPTPLAAALAAEAAEMGAAASNGGLAVPRVSLGKWLRVPALYSVAALYMSSRLLLNISQVYLPFYLLATLGLPKAAIAAVPLALYVASLAATPFLKRANVVLGRDAVLALSLALCLGTSIAWGFIPAGNLAQAWAIAAAALLGWASSCAMVTTLTMAADVIGDKCASGAIIYGLLSLTDKLSSGLAIVFIQAFDPCADPAPAVKEGAPFLKCSQADGPSAEYYRTVMALVPGGAAALGLAVLALGALVRLGGCVRSQELGDAAKPLLGGEEA